MTSTQTAEWLTAPREHAVPRPISAVDHWLVARDGDRMEILSRVRVNGDDPHLLGHFPGRPVFPGVFVIEALCQTMALATEGEGAAQVLRTLRSVRFLAPLLDGDEQTLEITAHRRDLGWSVTAEGTRTDGTVTARIRADFLPEAAAHA